MASQTKTDSPVEQVGIIATWREAPAAAKALLLGTFINRLGEFVQIFLVLYLVNRGFSTTQAGTALGVYGVGAVVGVLVGGWLTDRLGARDTIVYSMLGAAALTPVVLFVDNYLLLLVLLALVAAIGQAYRPASTSLLSTLTPANRQVMIFAMCRLAINVGATAGPLIGTALILLSYDLLFWAETVAALALAGVIVAAVPRGPADRSAASPENESTERGDSAGKAAGKQSVSYLAVLADRRYLLFLFAMFASSIIYIQYLSVLPLTVRERGLSTVVYGVLLAVNGLLVITCELFVAKIVQRWQPRTAIIAGVALTAIGMSLYGLPWGVVALVVATLVWSLGEIIGYPTLFFAYPAQAGPPELQGRYLGASNSLYGLGSAVGPALGIAVWNGMGDVMWAWCGAIGLVAVAAAWFGVRPRPATESATT